MDGTVSVIMDTNIITVQTRNYPNNIVIISKIQGHSTTGPETISVKVGLFVFVPMRGSDLVVSVPNFLDNYDSLVFC